MLRYFQNILENTLIIPLDTTSIFIVVLIHEGRENQHNAALLSAAEISNSKIHCGFTITDTDRFKQRGHRNVSLVLQ